MLREDVWSLYFLYTRKLLAWKCIGKKARAILFFLGKSYVRNAVHVYLCILVFSSLNSLFLETENAERLIQSMMKVIQAGLM